jgi:tape measure domain-containing protein
MAKASIAQAYVQIVPTTDGLKGELDKQFKPVAESTGRGFGGFFSNAVKGTLAVGAAVAGTALAGVGVAVNKGFGRLTAIENARNLLSGIGNDADTVEVVMGNALNSVRGTAFGLDAAAGVAASAVASGIKPGEDLERILGIVADTATVAGSSMDDIGQIMGKVTTTNKASNSELQQLAERGIPVYQFLADQIGVTSDEIFAMASDGEISLDMLSEALETNLSGAALNAGETTQGAMANVGAAISRVGANLIGGVFAELPGFFTDVIAELGPIEDLAKDLGGELAASLEPALKALVDVLPSLLEGIIPLLPLLVEFIAFVVDLGLRALPYIIEAITIAAQGTADFVDWVIESKDSLKVLGAMAVTTALLIGIFTVATKVKAAGGILAMMKATKLATVAQRIFNFTMMANPIGLIVAAIAVLVTGLVVFFTSTEAGKEAWASFTGFLSDLWEGMKAAGASLMDAFAQIGEFFSNLGSAIAEFFVAAGELLYGIGKAILEGLFEGIKFVWAIITFWWVDLPLAILGFLATAATWLVGIGKDILNGLWEGVKFVWGLVRFWFLDMPKIVLGWLATAATWLVDTGRNIITGLWDGIKAIWELVTGWFTSMQDTVLEWLAGAIDWLYDIGRDIITGLWNGLKSAWTAVANWVSEKVSWIISSFKNALKIQSPSGVFRDIGQDIGMGLLLGLGDNEKLIDSTIETMVKIPNVTPSNVMGNNMRAGGPTVVYNAAPNQSLTAEQELIKAMRRARLVTQW